jgi:hypothetical protein
LKDFLAWYSAEARPGLSSAIVQQYRSVLESASLAPASINLRLSAIRKLAAEAAEKVCLIAAWPREWLWCKRGSRRR